MTLKALMTTDITQLKKEQYNRLSISLEKINKWPNMYKKRCSPSLAIREGQIKTLRLYFTPTKMAMTGNSLAVQWLVISGGLNLQWFEAGSQFPSQRLKSGHGSKSTESWTIR